MSLLTDLMHFRRIAWLWLVILVLSIAGVSLYLLKLESQLVESIALKDAAQYSNALTQFRTLYTSEVVERAREGGTMVTHNYLEEPGSIPLPATLSILLGNRMDQSSEASVSLYSDYPFPWRRAAGGPRDSFQWRALAQLREDPSRAVTEFQSVQGHKVLRYATADLMRPSCVACHNSHPDSPKTDWKVGDIRGVLEVTRPIVERQTPARATLRNFVALLAAIVIIGMAGLTLLAARLRRQSSVSAQLASEAIRINRELEQESSERARAQAQSQEFEAQVHHAQKLESIGILAGGIAHDFNNLLMAVQGNSELALAQLPEDSRARDNLLKIERSAVRAAELTEQLLVYAGRARRERTQVDLGALVRDMSRLLATSVPPGVQQSYELADSLPTVTGDSAQLQQVIMNLITNAAEACGSSGRVRVTTGIEELHQEMLTGAIFGSEVEPGPYVYLEVEDDGVGIDDATLARIFDPFFSTKSDGRGLGLAALQGIVRSHGGALIVVSTPGHGTRFRVLIPEAPAEPAKVPATVPTTHSRQVTTILLVDDNHDVREATGALLRSTGFEVLEAANGEEGLESYKQNRMKIGTVILDLRMPGMGGLETLQAIRALEPEVNIVVYSGYGGEEDTEEVLASEGVVFLQKPFSLEALLRCFDEFGSP